MVMGMMSALVDNLANAGWSMSSIRDLVEQLGVSTVQIGGCGVDGVDWDESTFPDGCIEASKYAP